MDGRHTIRHENLVPPVLRRSRIPIEWKIEYAAISSGQRDDMVELEDEPEWAEDFYRRDLTEIFPG